MSDGAKDWASIRVHEPVRDEARDLDGYTYTDIMQAGIDAIENGNLVQESSEVQLSDEDIQHIINEIAATADGEGRVDDDSIAREVVSQMDYAALADSVAEEVVRRLQG